MGESIATLTLRICDGTTTDFGPLATYPHRSYPGYSRDNDKGVHDKRLKWEFTSEKHAKLTSSFKQYHYAVCGRDVPSDQKIPKIPPELRVSKSLDVRIPPLSCSDPALQVTLRTTHTSCKLLPVINFCRYTHSDQVSMNSKMLILNLVAIGLRLLASRTITRETLTTWCVGHALPLLARIVPCCGNVCRSS